MAAEQKKPKRRSVKKAKKSLGNTSPKSNKTGSTKKTKAKTSARRIKKLNWPKIIIASVLTIALACVALFCWDRWFRFDDAADFRGQWVYKNEGSSVSVTIDADSIAFTDDVEYEYQLNTQNKKVSLAFGSLSSENVYRFSSDRNTLYIAEDAKDDFFLSVKMLFDVASIDEGFNLEKTTILERA